MKEQDILQALQGGRAPELPRQVFADKLHSQMMEKVAHQEQAKKQAGAQMSAGLNHAPTQAQQPSPFYKIPKKDAKESPFARFFSSTFMKVGAPMIVLAIVIVGGAGVLSRQQIRDHLSPQPDGSVIVMDTSDPGDITTDTSEPTLLAFDTTNTAPDPTFADPLIIPSITTNTTDPTTHTSTITPPPSSYTGYSDPVAITADPTIEPIAIAADPVEDPGHVIPAGDTVYARVTAGVSEARAAAELYSLEKEDNDYAGWCASVRHDEATGAIRGEVDDYTCVDTPEGWVIAVELVEEDRIVCSDSQGTIRSEIARSANPDYLTRAEGALGCIFE